MSLIFVECEPWTHCFRASEIESVEIGRFVGDGAPSADMVRIDITTKSGATTTIRWLAEEGKHYVGEKPGSPSHRRVYAKETPLLEFEVNQIYSDIIRSWKGSNILR
jgi:hypothetical protein